MAIHTGSFIIRGGIFLSTDETHKAFVLFSVYLDIRRCFLYPKALRPQNYKAGLSYTWQFQAPFQLHVIHEHFCSQTLSSITKRRLPVFISGTAIVTVSTDIAPGENSGPQRRRRTQRMNTTLCVTSSRVPQIDANKMVPCFPPVSRRAQTETFAASAVLQAPKLCSGSPGDGRPAL